MAYSVYAEAEEDFTGEHDEILDHGFLFIVL
jgi:hypothetical protein